ncbi:MAG TPA: HK97 family phage prohead protease [Gemmataceae bacterium]|jgi:hypothetical protein|nr:HK97 family phage prohead protease [Gemmataceae bacterium]
MNKDLIAKYAKDGKPLRRSTLPVTTEIDQESRTAVHKITTAVMDRDNELIYPESFILDQYQLNPVVLFNHELNNPVGKALWIKTQGNSLVMKTKYPKRPDSLHPSESFEPDRVFALISCDPPILAGASCGFIPLEWREPTQDERAKFAGVERVVEKAMLLEVSMVAVPSNPETLLQAVTKKLMPKKAKPRAKKRATLPSVTIDHEAIARRVADRHLGRI